MFPSEFHQRTGITPEALLRLELLLGERVVDLSAVSEVVARDLGLRAHVLRLARDTGEIEESVPSLHECIVEIGIEELRESLRQARLRRSAN